MSTSSGVSSSLPISKLINNGTTSTSSTTSGSSSSTADAAITSQLGPSAFLSLLTTQLSNQDPLNPMDDTQSVSQLAQFSALQASDNLETSFANFQSNFAVLQTASLVGKTVTVNSTDSSGNTSSITGTVGYVNVTNGVPEISILDSSGAVETDSSGNPLMFPTSAITNIQ